MPRGRFRTDLTGQKFSKLTVIAFAHMDGIHPCWLCQCDCGKTIITRGNRLKQGSATTCGCSRKVHGCCEHPLYDTWQAMLQRCENPKHTKYHNYGGRGIKVCSQWHEFTIWLHDMGPKPGPAYTMDRINNDGNYEPTNCKWSTKSEQTLNSRKVGNYFGYELKHARLSEID